LRKLRLNIAVIYGSVRRERQGIKAARFVVSKLKARGYDVALVDAQEHALPILDLRYREYNHGIPPGLKNLLDHFLPEYRRKPGAIVSYSAGTFAGARVHESLREVLSTLGSIVIPPAFLVSGIADAFDDAGVALDKAYDERVVKFLDEFEWYACALKSACDTA
jgi:NAD(P)H-dependent FMN reductase